MSHNLTDHFKIYFPDENYFPSQNLPMERALSGKATNDIDIVLYNAVSREKKRVLINGRPYQDNNVIAAVVTQETLANTNN
jgi:hypothetical protein